VSSRLVAGDGAGDDSALLGAFAGAAQVAVGLQFTQGGGDTGRALREAVGERPDVDAGAAGERLDVDGESDGQRGQLRVLGEVVADHREAVGVTGVVVDHAARAGAPARVVFARGTGLGVRVHARVLRIHREVLSSSVVRPSHWDCSPGEGRRMSAVVWLLR
jgi:hypothetical protein